MGLLCYCGVNRHRIYTQYNSMTIPCTSSKIQHYWDYLRCQYNPRQALVLTKNLLLLNQVGVNGVRIYTQYNSMTIPCTSSKIQHYLKNKFKQSVCSAFSFVCIVFIKLKVALQGRALLSCKVYIFAKTGAHCAPLQNQRQNLLEK